MRPASILFLLLAAALPAPAQLPVATGICLVAIEPNSGDNEVAGIAHCGYSTDCCSYKLRTPKGMRIVIPDERFRGMVRLPTRESLRQFTPERELARLEAIAKRYPLAVESFSAELAYLRQLVEKRKAVTAPEPRPSTPPVRIAGHDYHDLQLRSLGDGRVIFRHRDGIASMPITTLTEMELELLRELTPKERGTIPRR